jgi:hypothetical protein
VAAREVSDRARRLTDLEGVGGVTYRQLDYWVRQGHVRARERDPGAGYTRTLTDHEYAVGVKMCHLVGAGLLPDLAVRVAREMTERGTEEVALGEYVTLRLATR